MRTFTRLFLACLIFYVPLIATAQDVTPSGATDGGETMAQKRGVSIPVDLFTGIPKISVPIFAYKKGSLNVDVGLNYFAGGVQVLENANEAGLSWNLVAGGAVTRSVRGVPDDYPQHGYINMPAIPATMADSIRFKYFNREQDGQADAYTYSCNGIAGKFMIGKDRKVRMVEQKNIQIIPEFTEGNPAYSLTGFTIITAEGTRYEFRDMNMDKILSRDGTEVFNNQFYPTAWNLTRIITPFNEDTVTFKYKWYDTNKNDANTETLTLEYGKLSTTTTYSNAATVNQNYTRHYAKLQEIVMPDGQSLSVERASRPDDGEEALKFIKIYNNGRLADSYRFDYLTYDVRNKTWINFYSFNPSTGDYISFLRRIVKLSSLGQIPQYTFVYNTDYLLPGKLGMILSDFSQLVPEIGRNSRDHWGFYNGKANRTSIPALTGVNGGDREPSASYVLAGSLKKMIYPSGMVREFDFESHDRASVIPSAEAAYVSANAPGTYTLSLNQYYTTKHSLNIRFDPGTDLSESPPVNCSWSFALKNVSGQVIDSKTYSYGALYSGGSAVWELNGPSGDYTLTVQKSGGCNLPIGSTIVVSWNNNVANGQKLIGGGIRIKKVTDFPANSSAPPVVTNYRYVAADGITSSGYMAEYPNYEYHRPIVFSDGTMRDVRIISSDPVNSLSYASGNPIGYNRVEVFQGQSPSDNGKTVYEFSDFRDINFNPVKNSYPYLPVDKADWGLGLLKKISIYDHQGTLKKETVNTFNIIQSQLKEINTTSALISHTSSGYITYETKNLQTDLYYPVTGRTELTKTIETSYPEGNANNGVTNSISYTYSPVHFGVTKITQDLDNERGLSIEKRLYYNTDYTISTGVFPVFKAKGITQLISTEEWIIGDDNPRMTGANVTEFQAFSNILRPYRNYEFASSAPVPLSVIGTFNPATLVRGTNLFKVNSILSQYDEKGFLRTMQKDGAVTSMMLSPDKQMPVVKIENAAYNSIAYTGFESAEKGSFSYAGVPEKDITAVTGDYIYNLATGVITRSNISQAVPYIMSFWYKGAEPAVSGATKTVSSANSQTGWVFNEYKITQSAISISGVAKLDEVRLLPANASMETRTYDPLVGITSECAPDNKVRYYTYDSLKRLILVRNENREIIQKKEYTMNGLLNTNPVWDTTGEFRCQTDADGITGYQEVQLTDINTNSTTWGALKWVVTGKIGCTPLPRYEYTGRKRCVTNLGVNIGTFEKERKDINPHSATYGTYSWEYGGTDETLCPVPVVCEGEGKKMINGKCETGRKVIVESEPEKTGWRCVYRYEFSDGSVSDLYDMYSPSPCM
ncbi:hypothetical protein HGH92_03075 [Chitinophaga varians]|uniref:YD repeat-containing protein n=1 Tax=Chitinophaga varians TaxID=2202339 RepID=A0A847RQV9_9BACT|nr:hypothetical protein [Chitinophaga varians]NLR63278.1 hypothetical protein [Chitinophaga varians]